MRRHHPIPEIECGVPLPRKTKELYPWRNMQVGDSLWFAGRDVWDIDVMIYKASKRHGFRFTRRKLKDGVRVWRLE